MKYQIKYVEVEAFEILRVLPIPDDADHKTVELSNGKSVRALANPGWGLFSPTVGDYWVVYDGVGMVCDKDLFNHDYSPLDKPIVN
jgi:hypothetical protein